MSTDLALMDRLAAALAPGALPPSLAARAEAVRTRCWLGIGAAEALLSVDGGRIRLQLAHHLRPLTPWSFALRGTAAGWAALWEPVPVAGRHDLFALTQAGELRIEGDLLPFMTHLQFVKDLLALPRLRP